MKLHLLRDYKTDEVTLGRLLINGVEECQTLEDPIRKEKIHGKTAIPTGTYKVIISYSPRFGVQMPLLLNVPGFMGVRIHFGNDVEDSSGCPIVGSKRGTLNGKPAVLNSRSAYKKLFNKLLIASKVEEITITIE
jgi:hypothetical protein